MRIECPSCHTNNKIKFGEKIICSDCKESFSGHSYKKFKKPLISATAALFIGAFGTYKADQIFFEENRYPLKVEYEIIYSCVNASNKLTSSFAHIQRTNLCICALDKTTKLISYKEMNKNENQFIDHFKNSISSCI